MDQKMKFFFRLFSKRPKLTLKLPSIPGNSSDARELEFKMLAQKVIPALTDKIYVIFIFDDCF